MSREILGQEAGATAVAGYKILVRRSITGGHGIVGEVGRVCGVELHPRVNQTDDLWCVGNDRVLAPSRRPAFRG
jgi:hypothetical protein